MLSITQSHNLHYLFAALSRFLGGTSAQPLKPLMVLVPSLAVGRWLTYEWASQFGICANVRTEYPANFMWDCFGKVVPETPKSAVLSPEAMQWRLFSALADLPPEASFDVLRRYLDRAPQPLLGRWQLAGRIAEVFGQYRVYRPDWLQRWHDGGLVEGAFRHQDWQAALWRRLFAAEHQQQGDLLARFDAQLRAQPRYRQRLPEQLAIFTTVRLPPNELAFFRVLSQYLDVQFFHFNPSGQYWADIVDERWLAKMKARQSTRMALYEKGHPLLTAWGKQLRDTFRLLSELSGGEQDNDWWDIFPAIDTPHLLARLQHSIHTMIHSDTPDWELADDDRSIQIHACHSLTRQLEVLHDTLLALFAGDSTLKPQDVVVMLPDVAAASGAIEAVFGTVAEDRRIPWQLTGVASPEENSLWRAFAGLYRLTHGRLTQSEFIDWLSLSPVATYYGLEPDELEQCARLLERAAVHRCLDGAHRAQVSGDADDTDDIHTFLFGLERLLLATALPGDCPEPYAGIQPVAGIEAGDFDLIGILTQAVSDLAERREVLAQPRPVSDGLKRLQDDLRTFFVGQVGSRAWEVLNDAIEAMRATSEAAPIDEDVPLALLLQDLERRLQASAPGSVPGGVVHFSRLGALRLLPYRVVCILGLEDTAYPRRDLPSEFDLLAQDEHPRPGDRSRRDDDKGVFLEALMAAEDRLLLFYNGFSNNQAAVFPPSTVVSQLVDYLGRRVVGGKARVERQCGRKHRLQPFSPAYFSAEAPYPSYAREWLPAARAVLAAPAGGCAFVNARVPLDPGLHAQPVGLEQLHRFYQHPAKHYLSQQLKLHITELTENHADEEPLRLDNLAQWQLRTQLLAADEAPLARLRASGQLPVGVIGEVYCQQSQDALQQLKATLALGRRPAMSERMTLSLARHQVAATLPPLDEPYQLGHRVSKLSGKHLLGAWLQHLAWQAAGAERKTLWLFLDEAWKFAPLPRLDAEQLLLAWLGDYHQGLQQPLLLAVEPALDYVRACAKADDGDDGAARLAALKKWRDEVEKCCFWRQVVPEPERATLPLLFTDLARKLYAPILVHGRKLKWLDVAGELHHD